MAIARNGTTATASAYTSSGTTIQWNHAVSSGSSRLIVVGIICNQTVSSMVIAGTTVSAISHTALAIGNHIYLYLSHAPGTGSQQITFTASSTITSGWGFSVDYTGAQQASTADATSDREGVSASDFDITALTTVAANCWSVGILYNEWSGNVTARRNTGAGGLLLASKNMNGDPGSGGGGGFSMVDSNANIASASSSESLGAHQVDTAILWDGGLMLSFTEAGAAPPPASGGGMMTMFAG